ncbi:MAG: hypothetical protein AAF092_15565 [Pseudomonadota bacterium]
MTRVVIQVSLLGLAGILLMWPALYNGHYFWFSDSIGYLSGASRGLVAATGLESTVGAALNATGAINDAPPPVPADGTAATATAAAAEAGPRIVAGGRSVYYGMLIYLPTFFGTLWVSVVLQMAIVLAATLVALGPIFKGAREYALGTLALVGLTTSAGFFVVYLMPDIFLAAMILSFGSLMAFWKQHGWGARLFLLAIIFAACIFHKAHIAVLGCSLLVYAAGHIVFARNVSRLLAPAAITAVTLVVATVMTAAVPMAIERFLGAKTVDPPFPLVRVVTDGPGESYLRDTCPELGHVLCDHLDKLPQGMDEFLWAEHGVYKSLTPQQKIELGEDQVGFVLAAFRHDPMGQLIATSTNIVDQLISFDVTEFAVFDAILDAIENRLPPEIGESAVKSRIAGHVFPLELVSTLQAIVVIASALYILYVLVMDKRARAEVSSVEGLKPFLYVLAIGLALNAMISGAVSEPHDRYQARIIWLIPLTSFIILFTSLKGQGLLPLTPERRGS